MKWAKFSLMQSSTAVRTTYVFRKRNDRILFRFHSRYIHHQLLTAHGRLQCFAICLSRPAFGTIIAYDWRSRSRKSIRRWTSEPCISFVRVVNRHKKIPRGEYDTALCARLYEGGGEQGFDNFPRIHIDDALIIINKLPGGCART